MREINFTVVGKVRGKARPRFARATGRAYTTKDDKIYEQMVREAYNGSESFLDTSNPLRAEIDVYHKVPKSYSKKRRLQCLTGGRPTSKPDLDNIAKVILDSNNGILYKDDSQISELLVRKFYTEEEDHVKVKIKELMMND